MTIPDETLRRSIINGLAKRLELAVAHSMLIKKVSVGLVLGNETCIGEGRCEIEELKVDIFVAVSLVVQINRSFGAKHVGAVRPPTDALFIMVVPVTRIGLQSSISISK